MCYMSCYALHDSAVVTYKLFMSLHPKNTMKKRYVHLFFIFIAVTTATGIATGLQSIFSPQIIYAQNNISESPNDSIEKAWETTGQLKSPESVAYDPNKNMLYISNIDGNPDEKDGKGFISKVSSTNGSIIDLDWISGLNAPKGIDLDGNTGKLYVSDITDLIEIDPSDGKIANRYPALKNSSLNDVVVDSKGNVFVSDPPNNAIFTIGTNNSGGKGNPLQLWLKSKELNGPNGLTLDPGKNLLVIASMGKGTPEAGGTVKAVEATNKTIIDIGKEGVTVPVGILDGLQISSDGKSYYVSDWNVKNIHIVDSSGKGYRQMLDTPTLGIADFRLIGSEKEFIIPIMTENKTAALVIK
jgi:sugar lactone lactonase YvrE